jgi:hypothetical protein
MTALREVFGVAGRQSIPGQDHGGFAEAASQRSLLQVCREHLRMTPQIMGRVDPEPSWYLRGKTVVKCQECGEIVLELLEHTPGGETAVACRHCWGVWTPRVFGQEQQRSFRKTLVDYTSWRKQQERERKAHQRYLNSDQGNHIVGSWGAPGTGKGR